MFPYTVREIDAKTALSPSSMKELKYAVNPYSGCTHGCLYCYAMDMTPVRDGDTVWGKNVYIKRNFLDLLGREVKSARRGIVGMSTVTDAYQPVETKYKLARGTLKILLSHGFRVTIQTKSSLVLRDFDLLSSHWELSDVGTTITTTDTQMARLMEPLTPGPKARIKILENAEKENIKRWIFYGPVIRGFNDSSENVNSILDIAQSTGTRIIMDRYNSYQTPDRLMTDKKINVKGSSDEKWWKKFSAEFMEQCRIRGVRCNLETDEWFFQNLDTVRTLF